MPCLLCALPATIGTLCTQHGVAIASPRITSEQILSRAQPPAAALVDAWGCAHAIAEGTQLGRDRERNDLAVLHASISSRHATFVRVRGAWRVVDEASRNGTEVEGERVRDQLLAGGTMIRFGDVAFYFWSEPLAAGARPSGQGRTARADSHEAYRATAALATGEPLVLLQRVDDGVLRIGDASIELAMMEFGLVRLLLERRRQQPDAEFAYVAWHEIAAALTFKSIETDAENVRELVHRVRRKLGKTSLIESKRGIGYRIAAVPE